MGMQRGHVIHIILSNMTGSDIKEYYPRAVEYIEKKHGPVSYDKANCLIKYETILGIKEIDIGQMDELEQRLTHNYSQLKKID